MRYRNPVDDPTAKFSTAIDICVHTLSILWLCSESKKIIVSKYMPTQDKCKIIVDTLSKIDRKIDILSKEISLIKEILRERNEVDMVLVPRNDSFDSLVL